MARPLLREPFSPTSLLSRQAPKFAFLAGASHYTCLFIFISIL